MRTGLVALTLVTIAAGPAFAQNSKHVPAAQSRVLSLQNIVLGTPTLGRFTKTPDGNFNSTAALEDGRASGMGAGPDGGVPNIN